MPLELCMSDFVSLNELALQTLSTTKADGGEDAELAQEVEGLYLALQRLELEISKAEYLITNPDSNFSLELKAIWKGCRRALLKVGNDEIIDIERIRSKLCQHTSAVLLCLNLINAGSPGRIARRMNFQGRDMSKMRQSLNLIVAQLASRGDGSVLTSGSEEDVMIWGELEKKLVRKGYAITVVRENKKILLDYVKELGDRGMLDDSVIARDVNDMPMGVSFDFDGLPTPASWISNNVQYGSIDSSSSDTRSTRSFSDLPLRDFDLNFDGYETPELETDQSDYDSVASSDDESEGTSFTSEDLVEGKIRRTSESIVGLSRQASDVEVPGDKAEIRRHVPLLRPISPKSMPISPLDIGFPRYTPAFYQPHASPLLDTGYEPPSRSRLANASALEQSETLFSQKHQAEDEQQTQQQETQADTSFSQANEQGNFNPAKITRSATISEQLALLDLEAKEEAIRQQRLATRRRANSALARLLESEEAHNFRQQRLESLLAMSSPSPQSTSPLNPSSPQTASSSPSSSSLLFAEKAKLDEISAAAKIERKEIRKQKLKWLLEADGLQVGMARGWGRKSLFERTIGVSDIFNTFAVGGPVYRFVFHEGWVGRREDMGASE